VQAFFERMNSFPNLPSWLQAFTAFVALGVSVWAVIRSSSSQRKRDRLESRGIAVAVYPEILMLPTIIQNVRDNLRLLTERNANLVGQSVAASVQQIARIEIPPMLDRNIDRLFMLGDLGGPSCLQLVRLIMQHNTTVDALANGMVVMGRQWPEVVGQIEPHLALLEKVVEKCEHEIKPLHGAIRG